MSSQELADDNMGEGKQNPTDEGSEAHVKAGEAGGDREKGGNQQQSGEHQGKAQGHQPEEDPEASLKVAAVELARGRNESDEDKHHNVDGNLRPAR